MKRLQGGYGIKETLNTSFPARLAASTARTNTHSHNYGGRRQKSYSRINWYWRMPFDKNKHLKGLDVTG